MESIFNCIVFLIDSKNKRSIAKKYLRYLPAYNNLSICIKKKGIDIVSVLRKRNKIIKSFFSKMINRNEYHDLNCKMEWGWYQIKLNVPKHQKPSYSIYVKQPLMENILLKIQDEVELFGIAIIYPYMQNNLWNWRIFLSINEKQMYVDEETISIEESNEIHIFVKYMEGNLKKKGNDIRCFTKMLLRYG